jgi:ABC-2 type transport system ATP-binding protein
MYAALFYGIFYGHGLESRVDLSMLRKKPRVEGIPNPLSYVAQVAELDSVEVYHYPDGTEAKVLRGISFDIRRGDIWGILGSEAFEIELLLEIIGSVRPYGSGRCILAERGMMRKKRRILPHVFFIVDGDVTFPNMNTLEYLMFATANTHLSAAERQTEILQRLLDTDLYYLALVPIRFLSRAQKAVICLLAASFTKALLVIFSVTLLEFDNSLSKGIRGIAEIISQRGSALLIGTKDCNMIQETCTHTAFLTDGRIEKKGTMEDMLARLDKRIYVVTCKDPQSLSEKLMKLDPALNTAVYGQDLHIYDYREAPISQLDFLELIKKTGEPIESMQTSKKTLANAYREALSDHDL